MQTIAHNNIKWLNLKSPTKESIDNIKENFALHPLVTKELLTLTRHSKINFYDDHFFLVFHFPVYDRKKKLVTPFEIDLIVTKDSLITIQYGGRHEELEKLLQKISNSEEIKKEFMSRGSGFLLYKILEELLDSLFAQLDHIIKKVDFAEKQLFKKQDIKMATELSSLRSEASDFRRTIKLNSTILKILYDKGVDFWGIEIAPYFTELENTNERVFELINNELETLSILHDTNQSLLSNKMNIIMKTLTIFAVIVFPLTLFSSIWGMNVQGMPIAGRPYGFWILLGLMGLTTSIMLLFFKLKKWL